MLIGGVCVCVCVCVCVWWVGVLDLRSKGVSSATMLGNAFQAIIGRGFRIYKTG
jgi:hypothetical protein